MQLYISDCIVDQKNETFDAPKKSKILIKNLLKRANIILCQIWYSVVLRKKQPIQIYADAEKDRPPN